MIRIHLDDHARAELQRLRRADRPAVSRTRLEIILLSDAGWSAPRIAGHLGVHPHTARAALKGFAARGTAALDPDRPGPDPDHARRADVTGRLRDLLGQERTWTSPQLAAALKEQGLALSARQALRYLRLLDAGYRRTAQSVGHEQDRPKAERAERVPGGLKKKYRPAACASSTWTRAGSPRPCPPPTAGACPASGSGSRTSTRGAGG